MNLVVVITLIEILCLLALGCDCLWDYSDFRWWFSLLRWHICLCDGVCCFFLRYFIFLYEETAFACW